MFDTREYDIECTDISMKKHTTYIIAEKTFSKVDTKGMKYLTMEEIANRKNKNTKMTILEGMIHNDNKYKNPKITTCGC